MSTTTPEYHGCTKFHYEMYHYRCQDREYLYRRENDYFHYGPCTTTSFVELDLL